MSQDNIKVILRIRPKSKNEQNSNCNYLKIENNTLIINTKNDSRQFHFDYIANEESSQYDLFINSAKIICDKVLEGYNGTIFVYGQTGAGKTYTLLGNKYFLKLNNQNNNNINNDEIDLSITHSLNSNIILNNNNDINIFKEEEKLKGIIPQVLEYLFSQINTIKEKDINSNIKLSCSFLEIYKENISDLLNPNQDSKSLSIIEQNDKIIVDSLSKLSIQTIEEALNIIIKGNKLRHVAPTQMNKESSRSHAIFSIYLENKLIKDKKPKIINSVFHLIDLAGSERQKFSETIGERLKEAGMINKSLMQLSYVIQQLSDNIPQRRIHYRDSKLTYFLKDSLGGNSKTCIIINISPSYDNYNETLSSLNFSQRANKIKNKAVINELFVDDKIDLSDVIRIKKINEEMMKDKIILLGILKNKKSNNINIENIMKFGKKYNFNINNYVDKNKQFIENVDYVEKEIENMNKELNEKILFVDNLKGQENFLKDKIQKLNINFAVKNNSIKETREKLEKMNNIIKDMNIQMKEFGIQNQNMINEFSKEENQYSSIKLEWDEEINGKRKEMKNIENEINEFNNIIQKLTLENEEINYNKTKKVEEIDNLCKIFSILKEKITNIEENINQNEILYKNLIYELNNYNLEIQNKNETIKTIEEKMLLAQNNKNKCFDDFDIKSQEIKELSAKYNININQIKSYTSDNFNRIEKLKQIINDYELKKSNLQKDVKEIKLKYDELINKKNELLEINNNYKEYSKNILDNIKFIIGNKENIDFENLISFKNNVRNNSEQYSQFTSNKISLLNKEKAENTKLKEEVNNIKKNYNLYTKNYKNINKNIFKSPIKYKNNILLTDVCLKELDNENEKLEEVMKEQIEEIIDNKDKILLNLNENEKNFNCIGQKLNYYVNQIIESNIKDKRENKFIQEDMKEKREIMKNLNKQILEDKNKNIDNSYLDISILSNGENKKEERVFKNLLENTEKKNILNDDENKENISPINNQNFQNFVIKKRTYKEFNEQQLKDDNFEKENNELISNHKNKFFKNKFLKINNFSSLISPINNYENFQNNLNLKTKENDLTKESQNQISTNPFFLKPKSPKLKTIINY